LKIIIKLKIIHLSWYCGVSLETLKYASFNVSCLIFADINFDWLSLYIAMF